MNEQQTATQADIIHDVCQLQEDICGILARLQKLEAQQLTDCNSTK